MNDMFEQVKNYDHKELELSILRFWEEKEIFKKLVEKNRENEIFSFIDGPITANNPMGVHHAWGRTLKDIFIRYKAMKGFDQRYQNGFDCQGLWVEVEVEKSLKLNSKKDILEFGLENFSQRCKEQVEKYSKVIIEQSKKLGQWMDWENSYYTMSDTNIEYIWYFLKKCHEKGWLYKGLRLLPWCPRCGTSLSQHELIDSYKDVTHTSLFIKLPIYRNGERSNEYMLVWTTTPWTLTANVALAVHPDLDYAKVQQYKDIFYLSRGTLSRLVGQYNVIDTLKGAELVGLEYAGPFDELRAQKDVQHRIVSWRGVSEVEGTGIVHIAPGCGLEDFQLAQEKNLKVIVPVDENGIFNTDFGLLAGMSVKSAVKTIIESLEKKGYLYKTEEYLHRYPICWRCKEELIFTLSEEWFISCKEIRSRMIEVARNINWIPSYYMERMEDWLNNMSDWNISRKRFWGLPLPFYLCDCGELTVVGSKKELEKLAVEGMVQLKELHRPWIDNVKISCPKCGKKVGRIPEVGDCWLDAGIVPFSTLRYLDQDKSYWKKWFPAEFICEMREQIRLWYYSMLFMSITLENTAPYKNVLSYEKVYDEKGEEMHKSGKNIIWFDEAVERIGADVMRWIYAGQNVSVPLNFGYSPASIVKRKILTLWNIYSFFVTYANLDNPNLSEDGIDYSQLSLLDKWILSKLYTFVRTAERCYNTYDTTTLMVTFENFLYDLSNWYVRRSRRRFWKEKNDLDKKNAYKTLYHVLNITTKVMAPILPFVTEAIFQNLVRKIKIDSPESIHLNDFPSTNTGMINKDLEDRMEMVRQIVSLGLSARNKSEIKVRKPLRAIMVYPSSKFEFLSKEEGFEELIKEELNVKEVILERNIEKYVELEVKPDFAILGPKYKELVYDIIKKIKELDAKMVKEELEKEGNIKISVNNKRIIIERKEIQIESNTKKGYIIESNKGISVILDTMVDENLIKEGLTREFIRRVQYTRKEANLEIDDTIVLYVKSSPDLMNVIRENENYIKGEVLAEEIIEQNNFYKRGLYIKRWDINGDDTVIGIEKGSMRSR